MIELNENETEYHVAVCLSIAPWPAVFFQENEDEQASSESGGQTPGPQRPRSNSGRELTDEVRVPLCIFIAFIQRESKPLPNLLDPPTNFHLLLCYVTKGNPGQCDDQESGHRGRDPSNPGRGETSCRDKPPHSAHNEADQGVHHVSRK